MYFNQFHYSYFLYRIRSETRDLIKKKLDGLNPKFDELYKFMLGSSISTKTYKRN